MDDTEVAEKLTQMALGNANKASNIGHLLPQIIKDKRECRKRLIELLKDKNSKYYNLILSGLEILESLENDTEIIDILINVLPSLEGWNYDVIYYLMNNHPKDKRVQEIAKQELSMAYSSEIDSRYATIAQSFDDEKIRKQIINISGPLPASLRSIIAIRFGEMGWDNDFIMSLLKLYDLERDEEVKTQASISYYRCLKISEHDIESNIEQLSDNIVCYGFDHKERRQAAFCGLVILNRLDIMLNTKKTIGNEMCSISTKIRYMSSNKPLIKLISENWENIKTLLGDTFWQRISEGRGNNILSLWSDFCLFADEYPVVRDEAINYIKNNNIKAIDSNILQFIARVTPNSQLLLENCLNTLVSNSSNSFTHYNDTIVAARILGEHFGGDEDVLKIVLSKFSEKNFDDVKILALCDGWPESDELDVIFNYIRENNPPLPFYTGFQILCCKSSSKGLFKYLKQLLSTYKYKRDYYRALQEISHPLVKRINTDDDLLKMLTNEIYKDVHLSEKVAIVNLINAARGLSSDLRKWCIDELDKQTNGKNYPDVGINCITGKIEPLAHIILNILNKTKWEY